MEGFLSPSSLGVPGSYSFGHVGFRSRRSGDGDSSQTDLVTVVTRVLPVSSDYFLGFLGKTLVKEMGRIPES